MNWMRQNFTYQRANEHGFYMEESPSERTVYIYTTTQIVSAEGARMINTETRERVRNILAAQNFRERK